MRRVSRRRIWIAGVSLAALGALAAVMFVGRIPVTSDILRRRVMATLSDRLNGEVELESIELTLMPRFHVLGSGLSIRYRGRRDVPPLIAVQTLTIDASIAGLLRKHVDQIVLRGLAITIPPDHNRDETTPVVALQPSEAPSPSAKTAYDTSLHARADNGKSGAREFVVDALESADAKLVIVPREAEKSPRVWAIHDLHMRSVSFDRPMPFDATLTNAIPPGEIETQGSFGPWKADDPGDTPLEGTFTFARADLGVFKGISGILDAHGEFGGTLGRLGVHGETDTPDFTVAVGGHPVPLHTDYHATVDGTNGDTLLDRIDGSFLNTSLVAKGSVVGAPGQDGRTVRLDVVMDRARLEDVLKLAVKVPRSPMTGALKLKTKMVLPPGDRDVVEKLQLDGQFAIATVKFSNIDIQQKVNELSHRSRGKSPKSDRESVVSNFEGRFRLRQATLGLEALTFATPGAQVRLAGTYRLRPETLAFTGTLSMDAKISETQTGVRRLLLKVVDPLFRKEGGGSAIPIKIGGTRSEPSFGLDKGRVFKRGS